MCPTAPSRRREWSAKALIAVVLLALLASAAAAIVQWRASRAVALAAREPIEVAQPLLPPTPSQPPAHIRVARHLASMQLVTSTLDAVVTIERRDESWRGDVSASVQVPVRYRFATDLSQLDASHVRLFDGAALCLVEIPPPSRLSVEVGEAAAEEVKVGWLRTRSRAGEFYLAMARKDAAAAARARELTEEEDARVRDDTRQQVAALVQSILGEQTRVLVRFLDQPTEKTPVTETSPVTASTREADQRTP